MKHVKKILLTATNALLFPLSAFAQGGTPTIASMAGAIAQQVVIVGTWIVVIMWVVDGILFLTSQGDAGKINTAKTGLFAAIAGTILIILANGAVAFVKNSFGI